MTLAVLALIATVLSAPPSAPFGLRLQHLASPVLGIESPRPQLSWKLAHPQRGATQAAYEIVVSAANTVVWTSGARASNESEAIALFAEPQWIYDAEVTYTVAVRWWDATAGEPSPYSRPLIFATAPAVGWRTEWITRNGAAGFGQSAQLRTSFAVDSGVERAQLSFACSGYCYAWLNGVAIRANASLGHTSTWEKRALFDTFLLDPKLFTASGANVLAVAISGGWATFDANQLRDGTDSTLEFAFALRLALTSRNGSTTTSTVVESRGDGSWHSAAGPYKVSGIFKGVEYDARDETPHWQDASYVEPTAIWSPVTAVAEHAPVGMLVSSLTPPISRTTRIVPTSVTRLAPVGDDQRWLVDFGQNAAQTLLLDLAPFHGFVNFTIRLMFAEQVNYDPSLSRGKSNPARFPLADAMNVGDIVYTSGGGSENAGLTSEWVPRFTYGGFRFCVLELTSTSPLTYAPKVATSTLTGFHTHSDVGRPTPTTVLGFDDTAPSSIRFGGARSAANTMTNSELLNRIVTMTRWTSLSNLMDIPTDCPTRERAGWTGDGGLTHETTAFNFEMGAFYRKWLTDIGDAQDTFREQCTGDHGAANNCDCLFDDCDGEVPPAAPWYLHGYHGGVKSHDGNATFEWPGTDPAWGQALITIAHHMVTWHVDLESARAQWPRMVKYMAYLSKLEGVDPPFPPASDPASGLLTYNIYADWDRPKATSGDVVGVNTQHVDPAGSLAIPDGGPRGIPSPMISANIYVRELRMMVEVARALGEHDAADEYATQANLSAHAFIREFYRENKPPASSTPPRFFADGSVTSMAASALTLDLFPEDDSMYGAILSAEQRRSAEDAIYSELSQLTDYHTSCGISSAAVIYRAMSASTLSRAEYGNRSLAALALRINVQRTAPSFGYAVSQNATALWEQWTTRATGTKDHIMFGTQSAWYFHR